MSCYQKLTIFLFFGFVSFYSQLISLNWEHKLTCLTILKCNGFLAIYFVVGFTTWWIFLVNKVQKGDYGCKIIHSYYRYGFFSSLPTLLFIMDRCLNNLGSNIKTNIMRALLWSNLSIKSKNGTNTCLTFNHKSYLLTSTIFTLNLTWRIEI